ncbi:MAG: glycosyltransferase family 2 protein [Sphingomonas sp.]|uniref:glycosyltransferase family 2 protein n=1 Tax=Sphingomonas sp. TaxID=28214 RepID=UPI003569E9DD
MDQAAQPQRILVFVPMYRCAPQITRVIGKLATIAEDPRFAILCVDNRSPDDTVAAATAALAACPVADKFLLLNDNNYGLGGSHKVAFEFARIHGFDYVLVLHGDDQGSIFDLLPRIKRGDHLRCDALLGARFAPGSKLKGYSALRTAANRVFNAIFSAITRHRIYDLGSGLNMYRRAIFDEGMHLRFADDLTFNYYLIIALVDRKLRVEFFPIEWREDDQVSNAKLFSQGTLMLRLLSRRMLDREAFLAGEHRAMPRATYPATLIR